MVDYDIIVVGAGGAGLIAARGLSKNGYRTAVIEARERIGGRIHTVRDPEFSIPVELGSEFIHGKLPNTFALMKEYDIRRQPVKGNIIRMKEGRFEKEEDFVDDHQRELSKKLKSLKEDITIEELLARYFIAENYDALRNSVRKFIEGYDAADPQRASAFAFRDEWLGAEDWKQYRPVGGYGQLVEALAEDASAHGCGIHLSEVVKEIRWQNGHAQIITAAGERYHASKIIITVPLGVLMGRPRNEGTISFSPALPENYLTALRSLGFGDVIKIVMEFKSPFWKSKTMEKRIGENLKNLFFLFTDASIPTWWTQAPREEPLLTGWLSGPNAKKLNAAKDEMVLQEALHSLVTIFGKEATDKLRVWKVGNWTRDPFARGAYSYITTETPKALAILKQPVQNTLFFAGESYHEQAAGTVEAALVSGKDVVKSLMRSLSVQVNGGAEV